MTARAFSVTREQAAFSARCRNLRKELGWSQDDLAAKAGMAGASVSRIEAKSQNLSLALASVIARALGTTVADMLAYECSVCKGEPPAGYTCNDCGASA